MAGLPVISTRVGGIPDAVGDNALLVDAQNPEQLATAMNHIMTDNELRHHLAEKAKRHVAAHYGVERMADQYIEWYWKVLNKKRN